MDTLSIPPLPVHPRPQPWEELSSFLARTARSMQYPDPHWLLHPEMLPSPITSHNLSLLTTPADYAFLAALLALSEEQLYAMTLHPLDVLSRHLFCFPPFYHTRHTPSLPPRTSQSTPLTRPTLTHQVAQFSCLPAQTTQICTLCLRESIPYDRLYWKVKYLITCPKHRMFLARACPRCHRPIPSTRMDPLTCPTCKHPYHTASLSVPTDASFLLQGDLLTFHALGIAPPRMPSTFLPPENDPRSTLPGAHYLALLRALSLSMRPFPASEIHPFLPSSLSPILTVSPLTPQERLPPLHIATIHWIFSQWPDHFITFRTAFQAYRQRLGKKKRDFPSLPDTFRAQAPHAYRLFFPQPLSLPSTDTTQTQTSTAPTASTMHPVHPPVPSPATLIIPPIHPLPLRTHPFPWEDMHSFLARTATRMQYQSTHQILQPAVSPHQIAASQVSLLTEQADYTFLSDLLLISQEDLYAMTLHRFSHLFDHLDFFPTLRRSRTRDLPLLPKMVTYHTPIARPRLEKGLLRSFFLPNQTTQICPLCLNKGIAYDRLYWKMRYLLTCPTHAILLLRHCSTCHKSIPSSRLDPTVCPFCHHPYHLDPSALIPILPEATCLLHGDLLTLHALGVTSLAPLPLDPRATYSPAHYFALMRAICIRLHPLQSPHFHTFLPPALYHLLTAHTRIHPPSPDQVPPLQVGTAQWLFTLWPSHFFAFLDGLEYWSAHTRKKHAFSSFPDRFLLEFTSHDALSLLSHAYKQYQATIPLHTLHLRIQAHLDAFHLTTPRA